MSDHPSLPPGSLLGGKFRIERLLGAGAMGTVYAIDHELTRHKRALKLLHPAVQNIPDIVRRFLNEASAAGRAGNPHLVETFDAGTLPSGEPYVVMELLEGETLGALLRREHALDPSLAAELVAQAAEGMEAAHRAGIIHRDLKPDNLFVTTRDGEPFIKIMDFGVSKFATATSVGMRSTRAGMVYGSPAYMSPEQLAARTEVDARTDVFALGVVLFECLTAALPFDGPTIEVLMVKVLSGDMPPVETLRPGVPPALVDVVRRALAPNRDERIPTARALVDALAPFRALPGRARSEAAFAATSWAPSPLARSSAAPGAPHSLPPGVRRVRRASLLFVIVAAIGVAAGTAFVLTRSKPHAIAASTATALPSTPRSAATAASVPDVILTRETPSAPSPMPRATENSGRPTDLRKPSPAPPPVPSGSASSRPSNAEDLGLRMDNPFR